MPTIGACTNLPLSRDHSVSDPCPTYPPRHGVGPAFMIGADSMAMLLYYLLLPVYLAEAITHLLD